MFSQLDDLFTSLEFEEFGVALIVAVAHDGGELKVRLHVRFDADVPAQTWEFG